LLEQNLHSWLVTKVKDLPSDAYLLFDTPGQVELSTSHDSMRNIIQVFTKMDIRLSCIHLVDSFVCTQAANFVSAVLLSLTSMLQLELPHVNVLTKVDLLPTYGKLDFPIDFYLEVQDLSYLEGVINEDPILSHQYRSLTHVICDIIQDFGLVAFRALCIQDKESVSRLLQVIDRSNGYASHTAVDLSTLLETDS